MLPRGGEHKSTGKRTVAAQSQAKGYEVYELYSSSNLVNRQLAQNPLKRTSTTGVATNFANGGPTQFFRVTKVP